MSGLDDLFLDGLRSDGEGPPLPTRAEEERRRRIDRFLRQIPDSLRAHPSFLRIAAAVESETPTEHEWAERRSELEALVEETR